MSHWLVYADKKINVVYANCCWLTNQYTKCDFGYLYNHSNGIGIKKKKKGIHETHAGWKLSRSSATRWCVCTNPVELVVKVKKDNKSKSKNKKVDTSLYLAYCQQWSNKPPLCSANARMRDLLDVSYVSLPGKLAIVETDCST